jgi:sodium/proline symporter
LNTINIIVFAFYLIMLVGIGYASFLRAKTYSDHTIAGRSSSKWVTAISAESSDMSGWLLLGLPGMAYATGYGSVWTLLGLLAGTLFNWVVIANRLRTITEHYNAITLIDYLEKRVDDQKGTLGVIAGIVIILFMIINSSAEVIGSGKLLNAAFGFDYSVGIFIGVGIVLVYTFLGGFLAVTWSNLIQGSIMFFVLVFVPMAAISSAGGISNVAVNLVNQDPKFFSLLGGSRGFWPIFGLIMGGLGIGIGYPGQPHILTNFMSIKDPKETKDATLIAMIWVGLSAYGSVAIGMLGRSLFPAVEDPEIIFLTIVQNIFPKQTMGIFAAAVMAAILSSVSAYLLVAASSFAANLYTRFVKVEDENKLIGIQRISIVIMSAIALVMSLQGGVVFTVALYAWGGLAACFGPLVIASLYWKGLNKAGATWCMITGMVTILLWYNLGLSEWVYELVPALVVSTLTLIMVSNVTGGPDKTTQDKFDQYLIQHTRG